jgi:hypothetical protein
MRQNLQDWCIENKRQDLLEEWYHSKNLPITPSKIPPKTNKKYWWKCKNDHEWQGTPNNRTTLGRNCPYCAGRYATVEENLSVSHPFLLEEWDYDRNIGISPEDVKAHSSKKVWWHCHQGHEWQATMGSRTSGSKCPVCRKEALKNKFSLAATRSEILLEWNWSKNEGISPYEITSGSGEKVWWKCSKGHEWKTRLYNRAKGSGCPICGQEKASKSRVSKLIQNNGSLKDKYPLLCQEWDYTRNDKTPAEYTSKSNQKVWWRCLEGHEWEYRISDRAKGHGCPFCSGHRTSDLNSLEVNQPLLVNEWNHEKNHPLLPSQLSVGSDKKVWWLCIKGHEWESTVSSRVSGRGCPICKAELKTSFPEQAIFFYLKKIFSEVLNRYQLAGKEIDIYIPSLSLGFEYDGLFWHKGKQEKELEKKEKLEQMGIRLINIKESKKYKEHTPDVIYCIPNGNYQYLNQAINEILNLLERDYGVVSNLQFDVLEDEILIMDEYINSIKSQSLAVLYPELVDEWHPLKNGKLNPYYFMPRSNRILWWRCMEGHEWKASIANRTGVNKTGCPICSGKQVLAGFNDLATKNDSLSKEWHPKLNGMLKPSDITVGSSKKVWWKCFACSHEWNSSVADRNRGQGCPVCGKIKQVDNRIANKIDKTGSLVDTNPSLAKEWHKDLNESLKPEGVLANSHKKVWWECSDCSHIWQAQIKSRNMGRGCPKCAEVQRRVTQNAKQIKTRGSLETLRPDIAVEWHPVLNGSLTPSNVTVSSGKKVWWQCSNCEYEWEAYINNRTSKGSGCSSCSRRRKYAK